MAADPDPMKIAIVHYHLRRGGVTRVIEAAREAMAARGHRVLVLSGEAPAIETSHGSVRVVPALNYRKTGSSAIAESLAEALRSEAIDYFGGAPDLWHFHNPTLAKNVLIPTVVRELAAAGERVVLQVHDFSEDGRPSNYTAQRSFFDSEESFEGTLYPTAPQIHYATINQRDHDFLKASGIKKRNLHVLPNSISELGVRTHSKDRTFSKNKLFAFYPTRAIRRKNIGEFLLLALIYGDRVDFATSLSPENPDWKATHDFWAETVKELDLPVTLGIADLGGYEFLDLLGWADFIVTTSVAEGFGLAFLEPWMIGKGVLGRDLPDITRDFAVHGLHLDHLYRRIDFPVAWLDEAELEREIESMLRRSYLAYDAPLPKSAVKQTWKEWVQRGRIDFGVLNETMQREILRKLRADPGLLEEVSIPPLALSTAAEIQQRADVIRQVYSPERYAENLVALYHRVSTSPLGKVGHLETDRVLAQFLKPSRLNLLRN